VTRRLPTVTIPRRTEDVADRQVAHRLPAGTTVDVDAQRRPETAFLPADTVPDGRLVAP